VKYRDIVERVVVKRDAIREVNTVLLVRTVRLHVDKKVCSQSFPLSK
jgi:hypothetical protein